MSEKVNVNRTVADALDVLVRKYGADRLIEKFSNYKQQCVTHDTRNVDLLAPISHLSNYELAEILVFGYKISESPEERFNYFYEKYSKSDLRFEQDFLNGMLAVAEWFGLDVKGVKE
ncbi:hypothetical protein [Lysinibacillus sp. NPDC047702]|uniref:hypothetical protein n=1 Tax=unclassified Lysinibacillus TaxID=2636778 RepID=UPI003CFBEBD7